MNHPIVLGVDLGGTNVRAAAYSQDGIMVGQKFDRLSHAQEGTRAVVDAIATVIHQAIATTPSRPAAVGMAVPGHVNSELGMIHWSPNFGQLEEGVFVTWKDVPLRDLLLKQIPEIPIFMGNDANLAALGEYRFGTGRNSARCLVMLTLGTGVGGGVVMGPHSLFGGSDRPLLLLGGNQGGGELGHMVIAMNGLDNNAGAYGAIEGYCQRDGIVRRAQYRLMRGRKSLILDLAEGELAAVTPKILTDAANQGDALAIEIWREVGTYLGVGIANCINIFAPDVVAIGGQIAKAGDWLLEPAREAARDHAVPSLFADAKIVPAELIADAGLQGGAALALEGLRGG